MSEKILLIDDELNNLRVLQARLRANNFDVVTCDNPIRGLELAKTIEPDIILLDVNMPQMSGLEVCRKLKNDYKTAHIPVILLTCMDDIDYKLKGFDGGADDYLVKDQVDYREIPARLRSILRRVRASRSVNPLTGLPGNEEILRKMTDLIKMKKIFSVAYVDIDNFKPYNDRYGFSKGDQVILLVAKSLRTAIEQRGSPGDFLGHIGGDDFVVIGNPYTMRAVAAEAVKLVQQAAPSFYDEADRKRGGIEGLDRHGVKRFFPFFGITVAVVDVDPSRAPVTPDQIATIASKIKKELKNAGGNTFGGYEIILRKKKAVSGRA
ncbi:response regulator [bacterium]|nr:response regulator [bacterium]